MVNIAKYFRTALTGKHRGKMAGLAVRERLASPAVSDWNQSTEGLDGMKTGEMEAGADNHLCGKKTNPTIKKTDRNMIEKGSWHACVDGGNLCLELKIEAGKRRIQMHERK